MNSDDPFRSYFPSNSFSLLTKPPPMTYQSVYLHSIFDFSLLCYSRFSLVPPFIGLCSQFLHLLTSIFCLHYHPAGLSYLFFRL